MDLELCPTAGEVVGSVRVCPEVVTKLELTSPTHRVGRVTESRVQEMCQRLQFYVLPCVNTVVGATTFSRSPPSLAIGSQNQETQDLAY